MSTQGASGVLDTYLEHALAGKTHPAVALALELLDGGVSVDEIITDLLAPAQRTVGDRWQRDELSVADEHLATGVTDAALHALADAARAPGSSDFVVVACAEGDWHAMAARMFAEQLRERDVMVAFLGASTPAEHVGRFIDRHRPQALAISCSTPLFFAGIARLADVAHGLGVPALVGGRGLGGRVERALALGADAFAVDADGATRHLVTWRTSPATLRVGPTDLPASALELDDRADTLAAGALEELAHRFPAMTSYDEAQAARTREDLAYLVRFVAAATLVDDAGVLIEFLDWLSEVLSVRGVPAVALRAGLAALRSPIGEVSAVGATLVDEGLRHLDAIVSR